MSTNAVAPDTTEVPATFVQQADLDGDGKVSHKELEQAGEALKAAESTARREREGFMRYDSVPEDAKEVFRKFDYNGDGQVSVAELKVAADLYSEEKRRSRTLKMGLVAAVILIIVLILANLATTFLAIQLSKESKIGDDGIMRSVDSDEPVRVASDKITTTNGTLVGVGNGLPIKTEQELSSVTLTSQIPTDVFTEMRYFKVSRGSGGLAGIEINLFVHGVARLFRANSVHGSVIQILTIAGKIVIDDTLMSFEEPVGTLFEEAGFSVAGSKRHLLGIYELIGFFNLAEGLIPTGLDVDGDGVTPPSLSTSALRSVIKVYLPCEGSTYPSIEDGDVCSPNPPLEIPGVEEYDAGLDGITSRHMAFTQTSYTEEGGDRVLTETTYGAAEGFILKELYVQSEDTIYAWQEWTATGAVYKCVTKTEASQSILGLITKEQAAMLQGAATLSEDGSTITGEETVTDEGQEAFTIEELRVLFPDMTDEERQDYIDNEGYNVTEAEALEKAPVEDEDGTDAGDFAEVTEDSPLQYEYMGTVQHSAGATHRFRLSALIPTAVLDEDIQEALDGDEQHYAKWDYYEDATKMSDGTSRPRRFAFADSIGGVQYNEVLEWEINQSFSAELFTIPTGFGDDTICGNVTTPQVPDLTADAPFIWPAFELEDGESIVIADDAASSTADSTSTALGQSISTDLGEGSTADLLASSIAGANSTLESADAINAERRRLLGASDRELEEHADDIMRAEIRRAMREAQERTFAEVQKRRGLTTHTSKSFSNGGPLVWELAAYPVCGAHIPEFGLSATICEVAARTAAKKAQQAASGGIFGGLDLGVRIVFYTPLTYDWTSFNSPLDVPVVFDGIKISGSIGCCLDIVSFGAEFGWADASHAQGSGPGYGTVYGNAALTIDALGMLPSPVASLVPAAIRDLASEDIISMSAWLDTTQPAWVNLQGSSCFLIPGPIPFSCTPLIGAKLFAAAKINVGKLATGGLELQFVDAGFQVYWTGICYKNVQVPYLVFSTKLKCKWKRKGCCKMKLKCKVSVSTQVKYKSVPVAYPCKQYSTVGVASMLGIKGAKFTIF